jgi:hypothetical protein
MLHLCEQVHTMSKKKLYEKKTAGCALRACACACTAIAPVERRTYPHRLCLWDKDRAGWAEDCLMGPARELRVASWCTGSSYAGSNWPRNMRGCQEFPTSRRRGRKDVSAYGLPFALPCCWTDLCDKVAEAVPTPREDCDRSYRFSASPPLNGTV